MEVDKKYPNEMQKKHNELPFLAERMEIGKAEKFVANIKDKKLYVSHIKNLNQTLNHGLKSKMVH